MDTMKDPADTHGRLIAAGQVNGTSVYSPAGDKLGSIYDVMLDKASGKADYAVMSFGGFLGMGSSYHPLPWSELTYDQGLGGYVVAIDRSVLEGAPTYTDDMSVWEDPTYGRQIDDYYSTRRI